MGTNVDHCARRLRVTVAAVSLGVTLSTPSHAQTSPSEHEAHHPGQGQSGQGAAQPANPGSAGPMGQGMGEMMREMMAPPRKELYPSLMALPSELSSEQRADIQRQAYERMTAGVTVLSDGVAALAKSLGAEDVATMHDATARMRQGFAQLESGLAAQHALAEGRAPRDIAIAWFKREMHLSPPDAGAQSSSVFGLSPFHVFVMAVLLAFTMTVVWMYFHKMRRAAQLLQGLTGGIPPASTTVAVASATPMPASASAGWRVTSPVPMTDEARVPVHPSKWSGNLRVGRIFQETPDVKTFRLMNPLGGVLPFTYLPGQFLTVTVTSDGTPVKRSYTIASSPTQHDYAEITVKHEEGGVVSGVLHARVQEGELLECSGPSGSFIFTGRECTCILLIGGGVGITPLMSVLRYLTDRAWPGDIFLIYGCKSPRDIIFREELEYLQRRHPNLRVVITVSHPEGTDWQGPTGLITTELIRQSVSDLASRYVHICGPVPMMEATKKMLAELGVPQGRVKTEAFGPALGRPEPSKPPVDLPVRVTTKAARVALPTVTFSLSDKSAPLPPDTPILEVADKVGVEIDNSCRVGTCGTCRVKLLSGQVSMAVEDGLEPDDKAQGIILACQAKSIANVVVEA
jgi:glycine betaine catabolism B